MTHQTQKILREALSVHEPKLGNIHKADGVLFPGSRGGHIVGTTRSGKPIYSAASRENQLVYKKSTFNSNPGVREGRFARRAHPTYTVNDHLDAAELHLHGGNQTDHERDEHYRTKLAGAHLQSVKMSLDAAKAAR